MDAMNISLLLTTKLRPREGNLLTNHEYMANAEFELRQSNSSVQVLKH